jgi:hypothetical protein
MEIWGGIRANLVDLQSGDSGMGECRLEQIIGEFGAGLTNDECRLIGAYQPVSNTNAQSSVSRFT